MAGHAKPLTPRQVAFVMAVVSGLPYAGAARHAGYSVGNTPQRAASAAARIAKVPIVTAEIERLRARALATVAMTAEWWRTELAAIYQAARAATDYPSSLRALELAGRHLGLLEPRGDADQAERTRRLTENLAQLMGVQMLAQASNVIETRTVEGEVRETLALASAPEESHAPTREGEAAGEPVTG